MSDAPSDDERRPRVVTLGGGHGQAALLGALAGLACDLTAVVSVADDGGCSGKLRRELGIPPPGDVRRCLATVGRRRGPAELLERRIERGRAAGRSVGNLALAELTLERGGLTTAAQRVADLLAAAATVLPVADTPATLAVYDLDRGHVHGESRIEAESSNAVVATVHGPERATEAAKAAILDADVLLFGPGSFVGSTLAVLATADVAEAVASSRARRILVRNVARDEHTNVPGAVPFDDHERLFRDHLVIGSLGVPVRFDVLVDDPEAGVSLRDDGSRELRFPLADAAGRRHEPALLRAGLAAHLGLAGRRADTPSRDTQDDASAEACHALAELATRALARLGLPALDG
jgi:uncharacterized cofD-like protein